MSTHGPDQAQHEVEALRRTERYRLIAFGAALGLLVCAPALLAAWLGDRQDQLTNLPGDPIVDKLRTVLFGGAASESAIVAGAVCLLVFGVVMAVRSEGLEAIRRRILGRLSDWRKRASAALPGLSPYRIPAHRKATHDDQTGVTKLTLSKPHTAGGWFAVPAIAGGLAIVLGWWAAEGGLSGAFTLTLGTAAGAGTWLVGALVVFGQRTLVVDQRHRIGALITSLGALSWKRHFVIPEHARARVRGDSESRVDDYAIELLLGDSALPLETYETREDADRAAQEIQDLLS